MGEQQGEGSKIYFNLSLWLVWINSMVIGTRSIFICSSGWRLGYTAHPVSNRVRSRARSRVRSRVISRLRGTRYILTCHCSWCVEYTDVIVTWWAAGREAGWGAEWGTETSWVSSRTMSRVSSRVDNRVKGTSSILTFPCGVGYIVVTVTWWARAWGEQEDKANKLN